MGRIVAIDYGSKRVGVAVTDPLKMIAGPLAVVHSKDIYTFLDDYFRREPVEAIVVGEPRTLANQKSDSARFIDPFVTSLRKRYPRIKIERHDERFTSAIAKQTMIDGGLGKMARREKATVDQISAIIILQDYLEFIDRNRGGQ